MHFKKLVPVLSFADFLQRVSAVTALAASSITNYLAIRIESDQLLFRRMDANNSDRAGPGRFDMAGGARLEE